MEKKVQNLSIHFRRWNQVVNVLFLTSSHAELVNGKKKHELALDIEIQMNLL